MLELRTAVIKVLSGFSRFDFAARKPYRLVCYAMHDYTPRSSFSFLRISSTSYDPRTHNLALTHNTFQTCSHSARYVLIALKDVTDG